MKRSIVILIGIICLTFLFIPIEIQTTAKPIVDMIDLKVDGSGAGGVNVSLDQSFMVISRVIIHVEFATNTMNIHEWGSGTALTNGIDLRINLSNTEYSLFDDDTVKENDEWGHFAYDVKFISDGKNPLDWVILARFSFFRFSPIGLDNRTGALTEFFFWIQDDLTGAETTEISVGVEGCQTCYQDQLTVFVNNTVTVVNPTTIFTATTGVLALPTDLDYFEERTNPYFWTGPDFILLKGLTINTDYSLLIASNFDINDRHWLNFTATQNNMQIKFLQDSDVFDQHKPILEMKLYLTQNNQLLETTWMPIVYPEDQFSGDFLTQLIGSGAIIIVVVAFVVGFVAFFFGRKRR